MWTIRKANDEDPQVLVPREDPLRQLPGRLVGRVAQDQPERDLDGQQQESRDPGGPGGQPDAELRLVLRCGRHDLVGRVDEDQRDDRAKDRGRPGRTGGTGARLARGGRTGRMVSTDMWSPDVDGGTPTPSEAPSREKVSGHASDQGARCRSRRRPPRTRRSRPRHRASPTTTQRDRSGDGPRAAARRRPRTGRTRRRRRAAPRAPRPGWCTTSPSRTPSDRRDRDDGEPAVGLLRGVRLGQPGG